MASDLLSSWFHRVRYWRENRQRQIDFMIIGIQKSGTSWLSTRLQELPDIQRSVPKETHFFKFRWQPSFAHWSPERIRALYHRRYWSHPRAPILFEASPGYMVDGEIARRIRYTTPGTNFVVILRNPSARAYSAYNMWVRKRGLKTPFRDIYTRAIGNAKQCTREHGDGLEFYHALSRDVPDNMISYGLYYYHLVQWFEVFPRSKFHIMTIKQLNDVGALADLIRFVGSDPASISRMDLDREARGKFRGVPMEPEDRQRLETFFEPYNQKLFKLLEVSELDW